MTQPSRSIFEWRDCGPSSPTNSDGPRLTIDPIEKSLRFRYKSELLKGSHGCIKKEKSGSCSSRRDFPKITLHNYSGKATVIVRLITPHDGSPYDGSTHAHKLGRGKGKDATAESFLLLKPSESKETTPGRTEYTLQTYIVHVGGELNGFCETYVRNCGVSENNVVEEAKKYKKAIENVVILRAEAFDSNNQSICYVDSDCISHTKTSGNAKLNICMLSQVSGSPEGGDRIVILCNSVHKDDVEVLFYHENWRKNAKIELVHYQTAIVVITPEYRIPELITKLDVNLRLICPSDKKIASDPVVFTYQSGISTDLRRKKLRTATPIETFIPSHILSPGQHNVVSQSGTLFHEDSQASGSSETQNSRGSIEFLDVDDSRSGLQAESSDPLLSCGVSEDVLMKEAKKPDEEFEKDFDEELFDDLVGFVSSEAEPEEPRAHYDNRVPRISSSIDSPNIILCSSRAKLDSLPVDQPKAAVEQPQIAVEPQAAHYLAYKLALSTARALHEFSQTGDVRFLLTSMRHLIAVQDEHGDNAIHSSVIHAQEEALRNLVEVARTVADYDILNMHNEIKQTPLHIAVYGKQVNMIHILLYHGADPNVCDSNGNTPMHLAAQQMASTCLDKLLDTKNYVIKYKNHTPDVDAYNYTGFTALHLAVLAGSESNVRILCSKGGCKVDLLDRTKGRSALHIAVETNNLHITKFLLEEAGAETDIHMFNGNTPLHLACDQDNIELISLLVQANADPYLENLEMVNREVESDEEHSEEEDDDEEYRGLTSLDLAQSDEVRRLLRGEHKLQSLKTTEVQQVAEILVKGEDKPEKKSSVFDSGIGLSGLSCSGDVEEDYSSEMVADLLNAKTKFQLADYLDQDDKWKKVANSLNLQYLIKIIEDKQTKVSPTSSILGYVKMDKFVAALTNLGYHHELKILQEEKYLSNTQTTSNVKTEQLEKQVASLSLS